MKTILRKTFILILLFLICCKLNAIDVVVPARDPFVSNADTNAAIKSPSNTLYHATLHQLWIPVYFASAQTVSRFLSQKSSGILSPFGKINFDKRTNQIWIQDDNPHLAQAKKLIQHLDQPAQQFFIKAKIINLDRDYQNTLGILFSDTTQTQSTNTTNSSSLENSLTQTGELTLRIAKLSENHLLNLQLSALEQEGHASLISNPELTTLNDQPAIIESGAKVPYQEATSSGATSVSFKNAMLMLKVTPLRMPQDHILLHITLNQDKVSDLSVNGVPAIETQSIQTQVVVRNHQTIVLGGIFETSVAREKESIPIINQIPLIGSLIAHHQKMTKQRELLIFITPTMIKTLS